MQCHGRILSYFGNKVELCYTLLGDDMASVTKTMTKDEIFQLKESLSGMILKTSQPAYTYYQIKLEDCTITAYTSGKVVFQGKDLSWMEEETAPEQELPFPMAGSDEVGTGDYFGPVVVAACIVEKENEKELKAIGIHDSKQITDNKIKKLAADIKKLCSHTILIVSPEKYNQVHKAHNMVDIKCLLHNQAYVNLRNKGYELPEFMVIDQFVSEKNYYRYLSKEKDVIRNIHFETKAENKYIAVACASVLARNAFLEYWEKMEETYQFTFDKGSGTKVDECAARFVDQFGFENLGKVAKLHFKNTEKLKSDGLF